MKNNQTPSLLLCAAGVPVDSRRVVKRVSCVRKRGKSFRYPKNMQGLHASLIEVARKEIKAWHNLSPGVPMIILFAFIHRFVTGKTVEESFNSNPIQTDYEI